jgi:hypothetical protein
MNCHICETCETIEWDLQDVARELMKRRNAQTSALALRTPHLDLEIRALISQSGNRSEILKTPEVSFALRES